MVRPVPAQAWVTLIVGSLAAIGVIVTWQQKNRADRRSEWWLRTTPAFERTSIAQMTPGSARMADAKDVAAFHTCH
jgi:hypothetical protein